MTKYVDKTSSLFSLMAQVSFQHFVPSPPLSHFVGVIWHWEGYDQKEALEHVLPSGTCELVVSLQDLKSSGAVISGARSGAFVLERKQQDSLFGIHFLPGGVFPFLGLPAFELENKTVSLDDLWPGESDRLRSRIFEAVTVGEKFRVMESWLLTKLTSPMIHHRAVQFALSQLQTQTNRKTSELADEINLSQRQFIQIFKNQVGLSPKFFGRVMRFQGIIKGLEKKDKADSTDWLDLALSSGYFDQAHFIHDFKEFCGFTPTDYMTRRTDHLNHIRI